MAAPTLRHTAALAGVAPPFSLCRDVLGLARGTVPARLDAGHDLPSVGLAAAHDRLHGTTFDVTLILAGSDLMSAADLAEIDFAVWRTREVYAAAGLTLRRVERRSILAADAGGHDTVGTDAELTAAGTALSVPGSSVPVVLPAAMNVSTVEPDGSVSVTLGRSPVPGGCGARDDDDMNSAVVMINGEDTARTMAHEIGHFLGCEHRNDEPATLMCQTGAASANGADPYLAVAIPAADAATMGGHCAVADDVRRYDPADFTVAELEAAARGTGARRVAGPLAVTLLRAKLGDRALDVLVRLATEDGADVRARQTAARELRHFPAAAPALRRLAASAPERVARAATDTLHALDRRTS